jgi:outer membrane protein insertion porin family
MDGLSILTIAKRSARIALTSLGLAAMAFASVPAIGLGSALVAVQAQAAVVSSISVRGNQRVDVETVRSYVTIQPGRNFNNFDKDESLSALYATGLFSDVRITQSGRTLIVEVQENPVINLVQFEGNEKVKDEVLTRLVQSESLGTFSQDKLDSDVERVKGAVLRSGRASANVTARVDQLENNRVNIIFLINEGGRTKIADINFIGNNAFGDGRLEEVISHNESNFLSWLKRDDLFDPDRLQADEERLRQFYYNRGYADFQVLSSSGEYDSANNSYTITFTLEEGELYRFGQVNIDNALGQVSNDILEDALEVSSGDVFSARKVEKTLVEMTEAIARTGYSFGEVTPRGDRNFDGRTIDITFFVDEGPRTYIERLEIVGNTRTREYVVRREFDISEGDAYNRVLVRQAKRRLETLGFFERVTVRTRPGSSADRIVLVVDVQDKPTGEISLGGGYSTANGPLGEISLTERNFLGRGQYLKVAGGFGQDIQKYELSFTEPYFLGNRIAAGFDVIHETSESSDNSIYDTVRTIGRLRASAPITEHLKLGVNYTFTHEENEIKDVATAAQIALYPFPISDTVNRSPYQTSSFGYSLTYANLDNLKNPREGIYGKFEQDFAGAGGDAQYIRTTGKLIGYYLASEDADIVLKGLVGAGHIQPFGSSPLRTSDHFLLGGSTIRGFDSRGFGPRLLLPGQLGNDTALGGLTYYNATAEVQFPIPVLPRSYGLRAAVFADAGSLFGNDYQSAGVTDDAELRASVGASLIWDSPFGPLRADFSHPLAKADYDDTQFFRFGVSTRF